MCAFSLGAFRKEEIKWRDSLEKWGKMAILLVS